MNWKPATGGQITTEDGGRVRIRHKTIGDARDDYAWQADSELSELDAAAPLSISYQQYLSEYSFDLAYPSSNRHEYAIDTADGTHIGNCVYYNVNPLESKAELGIMIGNRDYWNHGYGTEAVCALLRHVFKTTSLERIYLTTLTWNARAQKCFKKCGFQECGHVMRDGQEFLLMAIEKVEWHKNMLTP